MEQLPDFAAVALDQGKHSSGLGSSVVHLMLPALYVASKCLHVVHFAADGTVAAL